MHTRKKGWEEVQISVKHDKLQEIMIQNSDIILMGDAAINFVTVLL